MQFPTWSNFLQIKRLNLAALSTALVMMFFFNKFNFTSGGAIGSLTLGLVIKELWARGWPSWASQEGDPCFHARRSFAIDVEHISHVKNVSVNEFWSAVTSPETSCT